MKKLIVLGILLLIKVFILIKGYLTYKGVRDGKNDIFYMASIYLHKQWIIHWPFQRKESTLSTDVRETLRLLHPGEYVEAIKTEYFVGKIRLVFIILLSGNILAFAVCLSGITNNELLEGNIIERNTYDQPDKKTTVHVESEGLPFEEDIEITIESMIYTEEEINNLYEKAVNILPSVIFSEGDTCDSVRNDLNLATNIEGYPFSMAWSSSNCDYLDAGGRIVTEDIPEEGIVSALKHGTIVIGQLGLSETLHILIGKDHTTTEGMELAKRIEKLFNTRCAEFKKDYHMNFGVYYTPAENLSYTAFNKWKSQYGEMENVTYYMDGDTKVEKKFFTNSMHVPVWKEMSPFEKIDIESQLTGLSNAGCITYVEVQHEVIHNIEALEELVNYAMDKDIPYFALNCPADICEDCGHQGQIDGVCPVCGSNHISRLRRVTGYLTGDYKSAFNNGKQNEVELRVKHKEELNFCTDDRCTCNDD